MYGCGYSSSCCMHSMHGSIYRKNGSPMYLQNDPKQRIAAAFSSMAPEKTVNWMVLNTQKVNTWKNLRGKNCVPIHQVAEITVNVGVSFIFAKFNYKEKNCNTENKHDIWHILLACCPNPSSPLPILTFSPSSEVMDDFTLSITKLNTCSCLRSSGPNKWARVVKNWNENSLEQIRHTH